MGKAYRNIGIGLLIVSLISLTTGFLKFLVALILLPTFYTSLLEIISANGLYGRILFFLFMSLSTILAVWGVILAITLIKKSRYNKQLLLWVYSLCGIKALSFILYIPLKSYMIIDLITGVLVYVFLIYQDNTWSRLIKNKTK